MKKQLLLAASCLVVVGSARANDLFDYLFDHCNGEELNITNEGGLAQLTDDWNVGDCVMGHGSYIRWNGANLEYSLRVKTNYTTNRDIFHVQWFWGDRTATNTQDGPAMENGQDFQDFSGSTTIEGADPQSLSRPVVWWRACC